MPKQDTDNPPLPHATYEQRRALKEFPITLDGHKATLVGLRLDFPMICIPSLGVEVEFCWQTVARVIANGGVFKSDNKQAKELQKQLAKFAESDLRIARQEGEVIVTRTKHGNIGVRHDKDAMLYSIHNINTGEILLVGAQKARAKEILINAYVIGA